MITNRHVHAFLGRARLLVYLEDNGLVHIGRVDGATASDIRKIGKTAANVYSELLSPWEEVK